MVLPAVLGYIGIKWLDILFSRPEVQYMVLIIGLGLDAGLEHATGFGVVGTLISLFFNALGFGVHLSSQFIFLIAVFLGIAAFALSMELKN